MAGDGELNRVIRDLQKTIGELNRGYREQNRPVTDGSRELHSLCAQLEFLLQFDLKEKKSFFGQRKDYWDFLCQGLARRRQEHEGVRFVTSLDKLKTPVGRGRAFLRYCLVHRQLAESLQLCLLDPESLSEWYYARSPFLSPQRREEILGSLYELDGVTFQLALRRADLDTAWPMFSETLVRPSGAKTAPQPGGAGTGAPADPSQPIAAPRRAPARPSPPVGGEEEEEEEEEEEDVEGELDMEEDEKEDHDDGKEEEKEEELEKEEDEDEEEEEEDAKEEDEDAKEEEEDIPSTVEVPQPAANPTPSPPPGTELTAGPEASLLVARLRAELCRQEEAARALAARLAREERRHRQREESSARQARLREREAEALRETNVFLSRALAEAGGPRALARAQEEAQRWREVAEEQGARLAAALGEAAALASRLQDCQAALEERARTGTPKDEGTPEDEGTPGEVVALQEVLRRALELARGPRDPPMDGEGEGDPGTAADMAMSLAALAAAAQEEARQSQQQLQAQREEVAQLQGQLSRARQDGERWAAALQRAQREALEREATRGAEQARQQELIRDMKGRLLELLREKDALWQKTEGIDAPAPSPAPREAGLCTRCHKDFRLLSRRYSCRLCQGKVCHACSVDVGKQGRCCLLCYQQRHPAAT
uniref:RUN and FYVE domain-containing protein 4 n=1 Tax=Cairina moschata TaxID=8855 RepID=A0A8C3BAA0_CAIMO